LHTGKGVIISTNMRHMTSLDNPGAAGQGAIHLRESTRSLFARASPMSLLPDERQQPIDDAGELEEAAAGEREYLREKLRQDLGRDPTEEELDEWLREHTEGY
jgi:hypothetical protein